MIRVLIFGGSSSVGTAIFKELNPFYDLHATYYKQTKFRSNKRYKYYDLETDPTLILNELNPDIIISGLKGDFNLSVLLEVPINTLSLIFVFYSLSGTLLTVQ